MNLNAVDAAGTYTSVDVSSAGTTDILDPGEDATVYGVYSESNASATVDIEVTDGNSTVPIQEDITTSGTSFTDTYVLSSGEKLQANVTTADTGSVTVVVSESE